MTLQRRLVGPILVTLLADTGDDARDQCNHYGQQTGPAMVCCGHLDTAVAVWHTPESSTTQRRPWEGLVNECDDTPVM